MAAEEPRIWSPGLSGKAEQASDPEASAPDPYAQASHDLNCRIQVRGLFQLSWTETVLTFHPVLPMRAALVAGVAAALAVLALANLSPTAQRSRATVAEATPFRAPIVAPVAYSRDPLALARADTVSR